MKQVSTKILSTHPDSPKKKLPKAFLYKQSNRSISSNRKNCPEKNVYYNASKKLDNLVRNKLRLDHLTSVIKTKPAKLICSYPTQMQAIHNPNSRTPATRTQGFKPSSARGRGRGRGRGAASLSRRPAAPPAPATISLVDDDNAEEEEDSSSEDDETISDMAKVRKAVAKKSQQVGVHHEGEVVQLDQVIEEDAARYPEMEAAPQMTMLDVMPAGKAPDTNPAMVVNMQALSLIHI